MLDLENFLKTTPQNWKVRGLHKHPQYLQYLESLYPKCSLVEQVYLFENKMESAPKCAREDCLNKTKFHHYSYPQFCSIKCGHWANSVDAGLIVENRKQTNLDRYGVDNVAKDSSVRQKIETTNLERYGVKNAASNTDVKKKMSKTNLEKYGGPSASCNLEVRQKQMDTMLNRYGVQHPGQGIFRIKMEQTNLIRYGVKCTAQHPETRRKMSPISDEAIHVLENKDLLLDLIKTFNDIEIGNRLDVSPGTVGRYARLHGLTDGFRSILERSFAEWLGELNLEFKTDRTILTKFEDGKLRRFEIDRYCEELKFGIEINGLSRHSEILGEKESTYHKWKLDESANKGVRLIHVFEDEWYQKQPIVKNIIKTQLGLQEQGCGARSLSISVIDNKTASNFFNEYHIQGTTGFTICVGAFDNETLVGCMGFGHPSRKTNYALELKRFCSNGLIYPGLSSRLFNFFIKNNSPDNIVSFCDKRLFTGKSYELLGFTNTGDIPPDYYYVENYAIRHNKSKFRLSRIQQKFNINVEGKEEWELMRSLGYDRIWDCGKIRFVWNHK